MDRYCTHQQPVSDPLKEITDFFRNTDKSVEGTNKIINRVDKGLDQYGPYIILGALIVGAMVLTQTAKNIQEISINNKKMK